ncbi:GLYCOSYLTRANSFERASE [Salix koriyanagi]|uniref:GLYCOSYLTRANSFERASE n=1 Tax=Salix koriyanagi TaxID=2511006 RepID=A0A9Q0U417_9ROSI|nr:GLYCOSYLTRANSFERASE [Salix koriyanagi]
MAQKPHVAIFPSPGMGHLIPLAELAKKLALGYDLSSTFIVPSIGPPPEAQTKVLGSLPAGINYISLPPVSFDDLPGIRAETQISLTITRSLSSFRDVLKSLVASTRLVALVLDLFGTDVIDIAMEFSVPSYIASLSTGMTLSLHFYMPRLDQMVSCEYRDLPEPVLLPGCATPVHGRDLPDPIQDRKDDAYKWLHCGQKWTGTAWSGREEIAKVVKGLMQGGEGVAIRNRMKGLKEAAAKAVSEEGSSTKSLHELVSKWKN